MLVQLYYLRVPLFARPVIDVTAGLAFSLSETPRASRIKKEKKNRRRKVKRKGRTKMFLGEKGKKVCVGYVLGKERVGG